MIDYLLRFPSRAAAMAALAEHQDSESGELSDDLLLVSIVTEEAEYRMQDSGMYEVVSPERRRAGFHVLTPLEDQVGQVAVIERESGRILSGDESLAGCRLSVVWAGGEPVLRPLEE